MLRRTYYCEYERLKYDKLVGKSFRLETLWFWESTTAMVQKHLTNIEDKSKYKVYLSKIERID